MSDLPGFGYFMGVIGGASMCSFAAGAVAVRLPAVREMST